MPVSNLLISGFLLMQLGLFSVYWLRYCCLDSSKFIQLFQLNANDEASIENKLGQKIKVRVVDFLRLEMFSNVLLIIYFQNNTTSTEEKMLLLRGSRIEGFRQYFKMKLHSTLHGISDFFSVNRGVLVVSEKSLGEERFRELVRRVRVVN